MVATSVARRGNPYPSVPAVELAVAAQVDGDHPVAIGQLVELRSPHVGPQRDAVQEDERPALASFDEVQFAAVWGGHASDG